MDPKVTYLLTKAHTRVHTPSTRTHTRACTHPAHRRERARTHTQHTEVHTPHQDHKPSAPRVTMCSPWGERTRERDSSVSRFPQWTLATVFLKKILLIHVIFNMLF